MNKKLVSLVRSTFSKAGLFLGRQRTGKVSGYDLTNDLRVVVRQPNPLCFDIGANTGQTIQMLQDCLDQPVIHAFEPATTTFNKLCKQPISKQTQLHKLAFGEQVGLAEFRNYKQSDLSSFLDMNRDEKENFFAKEELLSVESVQVDTLDNFCASQNIERIDLLKIDTQGFEWPVLLGGADLFQKNRVGAVLLELNFARLYDGQSDPLAILNFLRNHQMRLVDYYEKERVDGRELSWTTALFVHHPS